MSNIPFIQISDEDWEKMKSEGKTWEYIADNYTQPDWCSYPEALDGAMGCWSLVSRKVTGEDYCSNCECYSKGGNV